MRSDAPPFVLVVDDDASIRDLFVSVLRRAGADVGEAPGAALALEQLSARLPDAVVCDLDMPQMDGLAFCAAVRGDAHTHDVPILVVSGAGGAALTRALVAGSSAVLAKPCGGRVLVAAVERLLDRPSASWPPGQQSQPAP